MALTGLEIYKLLPKTNCKKCGFPTCLAFAMALAAKKVSLDKCPDVSEETKKILAEAAEPPIRTITLAGKYKIGGETVLFRHEKTFYNPCILGVLIKDSFEKETIDNKIEEFYSLEFDRVGQKYKVELLLIKSEKNDIEKIRYILNKIKEDTLIGLISEDPTIIEKATSMKKIHLIGTCKNIESVERYVSLAKQHNLPLIVTAENLDKIVEIIDNIVKNYSFRELIIDIPTDSYSEVIEYLTQIRRLALKKNFRSLGYPTMIVVDKEGTENLYLATLGILKYASIVVTNTTRQDINLSLVTMRLNIYTDPQKPTTVEPKLYQIGGKPSENSPLLVTTNFSLTYFSVEPEIINSKIPSWLLVVDTDGLSVLTAWAAEKFTAEKIVEALNKENVLSKVNNKRLIIPGYVAVMSGKLEELLPDWEIIVGPKEASGIPKFLKTLN